MGSDTFHQAMLLKALAHLALNISLCLLILIHTLIKGPNCFPLTHHLCLDHQTGSGLQSEERGVSQNCSSQKQPPILLGCIVFHLFKYVRKTSQTLFGGLFHLFVYLFSGCTCLILAPVPWPFICLILSGCKHRHLCSLASNMPFR